MERRSGYALSRVLDWNIGMFGGAHLTHSSLNIALEKLDLEGDWDSAAYDAQMQAILAEVEGNLDESADVDDEKPTWDDDIDLGDMLPPSDTDEPEAGPSQRETDTKKKKKKKKGKGDRRVFEACGLTGNL